MWRLLRCAKVSLKFYNSNGIKFFHVLGSIYRSYLLSYINLFAPENNLPAHQDVRSANKLKSEGDKNDKKKILIKNSHLPLICQGLLCPLRFGSPATLKIIN